MDSEVKIRRFKPSDLERVLSIERMSFPTPWSRVSFKRVHLANPNRFIVAEIGSKVVGYGIWQLKRTLGHLLNLSVDERHRKKGIGSTLLKTIEQKMTEKEAEYCQLEVRAGNFTARKFCLNRGYEKVERKRGYYPDGVDAIIMKKDLC